MNEDVPRSFYQDEWLEAQEAYEIAQKGPEDWEKNADPEFLELVEAGANKFEFYHSDLYAGIKWSWYKQVETWKKELTITLETGKSFTSESMPADQRRILHIVAEELGLQHETINRSWGHGCVHITKPLINIKKAVSGGKS